MCSATLTVTYTRDVTPPVITPATSGPLGCNPTAAEINTAFGTPTVTDACTTPISRTCADVETVVGCTVTVTRTWTAVDACTNTGTATQTVTYTRDVTPPVITPATSGPLGCNPTAAEINTAFGDRKSTCRERASITVTVAAVETEVDCTVTGTRTWTAVDACKNTGTATAE